MISTLLVGALAFSGRCLTLVEGKPEECRQYFGQPKAAVTVLKKACQNSKFEKKLKRRWSDKERCTDPVVGLCRITEGTSPDSPVTERVYLKPTLDASEETCMGVKTATTKVEWVKPATPEPEPAPPPPGPPKP